MILYTKNTIPQNLEWTKTILKNKDVVTIENIKIMYLDNIVSYDGTFKIDTLKIKDINYALKTCIICFDTSSKSNKKR